MFTVDARGYLYRNMHWSNLLTLLVRQLDALVFLLQ